MNNKERIINKIEKAYATRLSFLLLSFQDKVESLSGFPQIQAKYIGAYLFDIDYGVKVEDLIKHIDHHIFLYQQDHVKNLPLDIYFNFVLQIRINTESFQSYQREFYNMLNDLLDKDLKKTVLQINEWAFSEVHYGPTDGRTRNSYETYLSGVGRCGEQSTFLVDVLRSLGIPARQIYVPWWTHSDDRHAWVEVYIENSWYYFGACEPEEQLNKAWFDIASKQAGLVHTHLFSSIIENYDLATDVNKHYKTMNVTDHYTKTKMLHIVSKVDNINEISLGVINYGSLEILATSKLKHNQCKVEFGQGTVFIKANNGNKYFLVQVEPEQTYVEITLQDEIKKPVFLEQKIGKINLNKKKNFNYTEAFMKRKNALQLKYDNKIRGLSNSSDESVKKISKSLGKIKTNELLKYMSNKDKEDLNSDLILKHFNHVEIYKEKYTHEIFYRYLAQMRISIEKIEDYTYLYYELKLSADNNRDKALMINNWVEDNIQVDLEYSIPYSVRPLTFIFDHKKANEHEKEVLKVALARVNYIPARLNKYDGHFEFFNEVTQDFERANKVHMIKLTNALEPIYIKSEKQLFAQKIEKETQELYLSPGYYEISSTIRYPDLSVEGIYYALDISKYEKIDMFFPKKNVAEKLNNLPIESKLDEAKINNGNGIYLIVDFNQEPSLHIYHELLKVKDRLNKYQVKINIIDKTQSTPVYILNKLKTNIDNIEITQSIENEASLMRFLYEEPFMYPNIFYVYDNNCIFSHSGYQVGLIENNWNETVFKNFQNITK